MPYRRKDSAVWWVSIRGPDGKRVRRSTETTDRKEAEALEAKWKLESHQIKHWDVEPPRLFEELVLGYLKSTSSKRSAETDKVRARNLLAYFRGADLSALTPPQIRAYIDKRRSDGASPATINRDLAFLSAAINYANKEWDWTLPNPVKGRKLKEPEGRVRWISHDEAERLIAVAESEYRCPYLGDMIRVALHTGCRAEELKGLEWSRVDLDARLIILESQHTKAGRRRSVPLNDIAYDAIVARIRFRAEFCPTSPWVFARKNGDRVASVKTAFNTACEKAGITNFRFHDLRHTCAAWLVSAGVSLTEVRDLLGHASITMTERYAHLHPNRVREAVAVLNPLRSRFGHGAKMDGLGGKVTSL